MSKHRIPVRVVTSPLTPRRIRAPEMESGESASWEPRDGRWKAGETALQAVSPADVKASGDEVGRDTGNTAQKTAPERAETDERESAYRSSEGDEWRDRALRLQAEMATYRRRQQRLAQEQARAEQVALLMDVLAIADNLDRALSAAQEPTPEQKQADRLIQGVKLTRSSLERMLDKYGLERIQVEGEPFDPAWHEAIYVVPASAMGVESGTVVKVLEAGYRRQDTLFRPAKVVVAQ